MSVRYDPNIITQHAQALYNRASGIIFAWGVIGFIVGAVAASAAQLQGLFILVGGLLLALVGVMFGRGRAFSLQLQAQVAMCQVAIEANTRKAATATVSSAPAEQLTRASS
ncbi:hypothetical protein OV208_36515 [Corallococcus sp. bb12-1]|uniref:hypothetical protein n=1 Tax=Corallococcus sp. bb12-1 TaxID=2996784 RepID=UPI0022717C25|nr:hypothetical protein [Corallococcus sp. bb12-1]MCY1046866.1 hypothetical protein [Corallococcus sp. bb12-1]